MTRRASCTQAEIRRALKASQEAGLTVAGLEVTERGFQVIFGEPGTVKKTSKLDRFLDGAQKSP
jgi:hypothetical protein